MIKVRIIVIEPDYPHVLVDSTTIRDDGREMRYMEIEVMSQTGKIIVIRNVFENIDGYGTVVLELKKISERELKEENDKKILQIHAEVAKMNGEIDQFYIIVEESEGVRKVLYLEKIGTDLFMQAIKLD